VRKARLGFKIFSTCDELLVDEDKEFERKELDKKAMSRKRELARKRRCYTKNKQKYNARRRAKNATIAGRYQTSKEKAEKCGQKWDLTQQEWEQIWIDAGLVQVPGTINPSNPSGVVRTAYAMRGPNRFANTMMTRHDLTQPWSVSNCYIVFRSEPLIGSQYHIPQNKR